MTDKKKKKVSGAVVPGLTPATALGNSAASPPWLSVLEGSDVDGDGSALLPQRTFLICSFPGLAQTQRRQDRLDRLRKKGQEIGNTGVHLVCAIWECH